MKKYSKLAIAVSLIMAFVISGCSQSQNATVNSKMVTKGSEETTQTEQSNQDAGTESSATSSTDKLKSENPNAVIKDTSLYDVDFQADREAYNGNVDITVGDNFYATQINDWYMNFSQYAGKVVEIEGYYIGEYQPYDFVGRYGPSCPYCNGGYVSFEILSDQDLTQFQSEKDWIKVTGILKEGTDSHMGPFYYIEASTIEKMDKVGQDTVVN